MRIESLNIWGGRERESLLGHIGGQSQAVDIFCLQEVYNGAPTDDHELVPNIYDQIVACLPDHNGYFELAHGAEGLAMFVRRDVQVLGGGSVIVHRWNASPNAPVDQDRILQFLDIEVNGREITVANLHGLQLGPQKGDTPERLAQFQKAREAIQGNRPTVLCGDFNVRPDTASLHLFGMIDLISAHAVPATRTHLYPWHESEPYADYILVSPQPLITVVNFQVLTDVVSDHSPLVVEIA